MRVVIQRVSSASVTVEGAVVGAIQHGLLILLGVGHSDTDQDAAKLAEKCARLRIFSDAAGKFNLSLLDTGGSALVVSQFTLLADARKGLRPSFVDAARPEVAAPRCDAFVAHLPAAGDSPTETGRFGAHMDVALVNDGPVTILPRSVNGWGCLPSLEQFACRRRPVSWR